MELQRSDVRNAKQENQQRTRKEKEKLRKVRESTDIKDIVSRIGGQSRGSKAADLIMIRHLGVKQRAASRFEKAT